MRLWWGSTGNVVRLDRTSKSEYRGVGGEVQNQQFRVNGLFELSPNAAYHF